MRTRPHASWRLLLLFVIALLALACGSSDSSSGATAPPPSGAAGSSNAGAGGAAGSSTGGAAGTSNGGSAGVGPTIDGITLTPNAKVADDATRAALKSYDHVTGTLVFSTSTPVLASLKPGDVLMSGDLVPGIAPLGFFRRVLAIDTTGGTVTLQTTTATLKDAIAEAHVQTTKHYDGPTGVQFTPTATGVTLMGASTPAPPPPSGGSGGTSGMVGPPPSTGLTISLDHVHYSYPPEDMGMGGSGGSGGGSGGSDSGVDVSGSIDVTLNGWVNLDPSAFFNLDIQGCGPFCIRVHEFKAGVILNQSADVKADLSASIEIKKEIKVGHIVLPPFATGPLVWVPAFDIYVGASLSGQITVTLHATDQVSLELGTRWHDNGGTDHGWENLSMSSANGTFDVPQVQLSIVAKAYVRGEFSITLYDLLGPYASFEGDLVFDMATPRHPFLKLGFDITASVGVKATLFGIIDFDYGADLPEVYIPIAQTSNIPPFVIATSPADGTTVSVDAIHLGVTAYDLEDGLDLTYAWHDESGMMLGTMAQIEPVLSPGTHDLTVVVTDHDGATATGTVHMLHVTPPGPPTVGITAPAAGATVTTGLPFALSGTVVDYKGIDRCSDPAWTHVWKDETTGTVLASTCAAVATLTADGAHTLSFTANGPLGQNGQQSVLVNAMTTSVLTASVTNPPQETPPHTIFTYDTDGCLPNPADTFSASVANGTGPFQYSWTVTTFDTSGNVKAGPFTIGADLTTQTSAFPSGWVNDLDPSTYTTQGAPVDVTFTVTDSTGAMVPVTVHTSWVCAPG